MISNKTEKYLRGEFKLLSSRAVELKNLIDSAKTELKREFYRKKLKKNNKDAINLLNLIKSSQSTSNFPEHDPNSTAEPIDI